MVTRLTALFRCVQPQPSPAWPAGRQGREQRRRAWTCHGGWPRPTSAASCRSDRSPMPRMVSWL